MSAGRREDSLRLVGSGGANRVMESELLRLVKRSPFHVRVPKARRDGDATLLYDFEPHVAWVAACHHRSASRVAWDLWSSPADRLEPLFDDLLPLAAAEDRLGAAPRLSVSVEVRGVADFPAGPLQVRGVVKNALVEGFARRGVEVAVDAESPDVQLIARRSGPEGARRMVVSIDIGGGPRHRRGDRVAMVEAPFRETMAAQLVQLSRWDPRTEVLVDPMAGGGTIPIEAAHLATGDPVRQPKDVALTRLPVGVGLPSEAVPLFPGTVARILCSDVDQAMVPFMIGNLRAAGLTGPAREDAIVVQRIDVREITPDVVWKLLPGPRSGGVFCFNPPYGHRLTPAGGEEELLELYRETGRVFARFPGWRAAVFVANASFIDAFGHEPVMTKPASNASLKGWFLLFQA